MNREKRVPFLLLSIRLALWCVPLAVFAGLVYRDLVVTGVLEADYRFIRPSPFISLLRPQSRVSEIVSDERGLPYQQVKNQPVYFDVRLPRHFFSSRSFFRL